MVFNEVVMNKYRVNVDHHANEPVWRAYANSYEAFEHPFRKAGKSFWDAYIAEHNVELVDGHLVFESESHYTMFMLRWT